MRVEDNTSTMKCPIPIGIMFLLILGVLAGLAITPVAADTVMNIYEFQITTNAASQENPDIDDVHIVWQDNRNGNWDIYLYTLMSTLAPETRITTNSSSQECPAISGNYIVWQDNRNGNWDIYLYDITNKTETQITTSIANQQYPAISGNCVVWQDDRNGNWDIYLYDIGTQTETLLTRSCYPTACPSKYPAIYANNILYQKTWAPLSIWEPCLFKVDPATRVETYLSALVNNNNDPHIAIYQNRAVWTVYEYIYDGYHTSIWMYDLNTGSMTRITDTWHVTYNEGHPDTDGYAPAYIVYYDNRNHYWGPGGTPYFSNEDIFVYNLDRETETQVTNNTSNQRDPAISGGRIVFMDDRNGNWDIYMAMLGWSNPPPGSGSTTDTGTLYIMSSPTGATILINGTDYGTTNQFVENVPAGNQNLTLMKTGYQPYTTVVDVPAGSLKTLAPITLTKSGDGVPPAGTGTLYVMSSPTGATIIINGTDYGTTNRFVKGVPAGVQNLMLTKEGYQPYSTVVDVPAGSLKTLAPITLTKGGDGVPPAGTGTLYVMSSPTGATIIINGTSYGTTNTFVKGVPAGVQNLMLIKEGYQPYSTVVEVPAGSLKALTPITLTKAANGPGEVEHLQAALDAASDGDTIILKKGTYYENVIINKSVTLIGYGPDTTIINGNTGIHQNEGGVINISKPFPHAAYTPNVTLVGMTITGGTAIYGGGIFNGGGNLSLSRVSVTNNTAPSAGGIYNQYGTVIMDESSVTGNTANSGGGVEIDEGTFIMNAGSSISGNVAGLGGGMATIEGTVIMNDGSSISNNSATYYGGGIYGYYYTTITLNGGSITGNTAENGTGGGIYIDSSSTVNLYSGTVSGNSPDDISYQFDVTYLGAPAGTIGIDAQNWFYIVNLSGLAPDTEYWLAGEGLPDIFASGTTDANGDLRLQGVLNPAPNLRREYSPFYAGTGPTPPTAGLVALDGKECSGGITSTGLFGTLKEDGAPLSGKKVEFYTYDPYTLEINYPSFGSDTTDSDGEFCKVFFGGHLGENVACGYDGTWDMNMEKASKCPVC